MKNKDDRANKLSPIKAEIANGLVQLIVYIMYIHIHINDGWMEGARGVASRLWKKNEWTNIIPP